MQGGPIEEAISQGLIAVHPDIDRVEANHVVFRDGSSASFGLILLATGYRPALRHLQSLDPAEPEGFESPRVKNLFYLGFDQQRSFRSRYLRGIREDAAVLADLIHQRVRDGDLSGAAVEAAGV